ncbi:DUF262 domain-containing protein [Halobacillus kuroshimensis]|uniref:DUF262 domain-containing protein n=2 Tax=Halobacillus kuroshimensis TaxID=302481 RepID=A0ABS3DYM2_9BACI|nr:DUF262 domain-containing protein [Halobacillus kuroshimensis]
MMKANETIVQPLIEGTKQFVIPLFQRTYSWSNQQWNQLWNDIIDIQFDDNNKNHFIGSVVSMSVESAPHEVQQYLVIDGQQRLTTLTILLAAIRDIARDNEDIELAEEIHENLLVNKWKSGDNHYKLLPTQVDRDIHKSVIKSDYRDNDNSNIKEAYDFFKKKILKTNVELGELKSLVSNRLSLVSIVLASDDNPYLVFESLNAKGRPLTQADLIRNYFFMSIDRSKHEDVYRKYWKPMQDFFGDSLTEYIRHYLMRKGKMVRKNDVYVELKKSIDSEIKIEDLEHLYTFSNYYKCITHPEYETNKIVRKALTRLNELEAKTSYPFLLNIFSLYKNKNLSSENMVKIIRLLENYLIRRFVCNIPTNELNKIFSSLLLKVEGFNENGLIEEIKANLQNKGYPKDHEFVDKLKTLKLYGSGDRVRKTKFILKSIEESFNHKEKVDYNNLSIEHIMPQTLNDSWKITLGENWESIHENLLHVIGNLTLTAYNAEMSNDSFDKKAKNLSNSHLKINKNFKSLETWGEDEIKARTKKLAEICKEIWSYFGSAKNEIKDVKGTSPRLLIINNNKYEVSTWREVWITTLNTLIDIKEDNTDIILDKYPNLLASDSNKFKRRGLLNNNLYVNVDFSARDIYRLCQSVIELVGVSRDIWSVEVTLNQ